MDALAFSVAIAVGVLFGGCGGWKGVPNSPGWKVRQEQKPSDDVISKVLPSLDLYCIVSIRHGGGRWIYLPSQVGKCGIVQIADDTDRPLLLCVIHMHCILGGDSVYDSIWQSKRRRWTN